MISTTSVSHDRYPRYDASIDEDDLFGWRALGHWLGFVLRAPLRHKLLACCAFVLVFALSCAALVAVPFRYQVQASLLAGYPATALANPREGINDSPTRAAREVLLRRENLKQILDRTNFVDQYVERRPWAVRTKDEVIRFLTGRTRDREQIEEGLLDALADRLWVDVQPQGTVVVTFRWWDAELARQIVDAAIQSFVEIRFKAEVGAIGEAIQILESQRTLLEDEIRLSIAAYEAKREQLRATNRAATPVQRRAPVRAPDAELARLQSELRALQSSLEEMVSFRRQRTVQLQAELAQQEAVYAADHPALVSTRRLLRSLSEPAPRERELQERIEELEIAIARRGGVAEGSRVSEPVRDALLRLDEDEDDPRLDFERGQLENLLRQHADLRNRIQALQLEQETAEAAFHHRYSVVAPAKLPRGPIKPYPLIFLVGGLVGGIAFAFFAATAADLRTGRVIERWQIEQHLNLPVLAEVRDFPRIG